MQHPKTKLMGNKTMSDLSSGIEYSEHYTDIGDWQSGDLDYFTIDQNWSGSTPKNHEMWQHLYKRQMEVLQGRAIDMYMDSLSTLGITQERIPKVEEINEILMKRTGWEVVCVPGLIPYEPFFELLANRKFPAGQFIRKPEEMDYIQEPDIFHDVFGHVPILADPTFADYVEAFGRGGMKATKLDAIMEIFRVYWFTVEFGLIKEKDGLKIYGAGILSSPTESKFCLESDSPHHIHFDVKRIMRTHNNIDDFQENYFVIDDFQELFDKTAEPDFTPYYEEIKKLPTIMPGEIVDGDVVLQKGTMEHQKIADEKRKSKKVFER